MNFKVLTIPPFDKQLKRLVKKYPSLKAEIVKLVIELQSNPKIGITLGKDFYKIRIAIASKGKGKSGGARIITYLAISESEVYFLSIYDKAEQSNISEKELLQLLARIFN